MDIIFDNTAWINEKITDITLTELRDNIYQMKLCFGEEELVIDINKDKLQLLQNQIDQVINKD